MGDFANYGFMILPFGLYIIAAAAETNRAPFDRQVQVVCTAPAPAAGNG